MKSGLLRLLSHPFSVDFQTFIIADPRRVSDHKIQRRLQRRLLTSSGFAALVDAMTLLAFEEDVDVTVRVAALKQGDCRERVCMCERGCARDALNLQLYRWLSSWLCWLPFSLLLPLHSKSCPINCRYPCRAKR